MQSPVKIIFLIVIYLFCNQPRPCAQPLLSLNANGKPTKDILTFLLQKRGLEPIIDSAINSTTTVKFSNIAWSKAFQAILDLHQLDCRFADNFAVIFPKHTIQLAPSAQKMNQAVPYAQSANHHKANSSSSPERNAPQINVSLSPIGQSPATPTGLNSTTKNIVDQQELLRRAGLQEAEIRLSSQSTSQDWNEKIQSINQIAQKDPLNIRPRFGHLKNKEMVELSKKMLLQDEPLSSKTLAIKNDARMPDDSIKEHKGISLVGVTGPDDDRSAILLIDGQHRLLKKGSTVSGYKTISSIEHNKVIIESENGEVQIVQF